MSERHNMRKVKLPGDYDEIIALTGVHGERLDFLTDKDLCDSHWKFVLCIGSLIHTKDDFVGKIGVSIVQNIVKKFLENTPEEHIKAFNLSQLVALTGRRGECLDFFEDERVHYIYEEILNLTTNSPDIMKNVLRASLEVISDARINSIQVRNPAEVYIKAVIDAITNCIQEKDARMGKPEPNAKIDTPELI